MKRVKINLYEKLGWLFCEISFRWWDMFDGEEAWDQENWSWFHQTHFRIGEIFYQTGIYFYNYGVKNESW